MNDWIGKQLGQYEIMAEIGRGGMAVVYKAWQPSLGRPVAIKVLPFHLASDEGFLARFRREAIAAAQLNHSNIVTIHDVGQAGDTHFMVMEYLEGQSLYDTLKATGPLPLERVIHIVDQVASALDYAHQRGLVHRDIKPANIILRPDDHATLTDFGIVKALSGTSLTQTGTMVGTPQYMAPEQVQGEIVDHRADVYALGIVCYEMLAGVPPFTGDTAAVLYAQAHKPPPPLCQRLPDLPTYVEHTLNQALDKDPARRFATAGGLSTALQAEPQHPALTMPVSPAPSVAPATPPPDRPVTIPPTIASAPIAQPSASTPPPVAPATPYPRTGPATGPRAPFPRPWLLLGSVSAVALILAALLAILLAGGGGADQAGQAAKPTQPPLAMPTASVTSTPFAWTVSPPPPTVALGPTPLQLTFVLGSPGDGDIYLVDADGSKRRRLVAGPDDQAEPDWSPDGRYIVYQSDQAGNYDIWSIAAAGGQAQQLTTASVDEREPDWSPDGGQIVYRRGGEPNGDGELWVMDADGANQRRLGGRTISGRAPVWSPDGQQVAFMSEQSGNWNAYLFDLRTDTVRSLTHCDTHCRFPNWSPDGQFVVYHSTQSATSFTPVQVWRQRADGSGAAELLIEGNNPGRAAWSAEGLIAFNTDAGIEIVNSDGSDRGALPDSDDGWAPDWSR